MRDYFGRILRQESKGNALDDAAQGQLDIDDDLVELATAGGRRFHEPSGSGSGAGMSMVGPESVELPGRETARRERFDRVSTYRRCRNRYFPNEFRRNLTREPAGKIDSRQRPSRPGIFVTGPALGNSAQATSGCPQHRFCCIPERTESLAGFFSNPPHL